LGISLTKIYLSKLYNRPQVAAVPSELSPTPLTITKPQQISNEGADAVNTLSLIWRHQTCAVVNQVRKMHGTQGSQNSVMSRQ
jgi:hypothetical protein